MLLKPLRILSLAQKSIGSFAKLDKSITDELNQEFTQLESYYQNIQKSARIASSGRLYLLPVQFKKVLSLIHNETDMKLATNIYLAFLGNLNNLPLSMQDSFFQKCIHFDQLEFVLKCFEHQATLMYFPAHQTTQKLVDKIVESNPKHLLQLSKIIKQNLFIQVNAQMLSGLIAKSYEVSSYDAAVRFYVAARLRSHILEPKIFSAISHSFYQISQAPEPPKQMKHIPELINTINFGLQDKTTQAEDRANLLVAHAAASASTKAFDQSMIRLGELANNKFNSNSIYSRELLQFLKSGSLNTITNEVLTKAAQALSDDSIWSNSVNQIVTKFQEANIPLDLESLSKTNSAKEVPAQSN